MGQDLGGVTGEDDGHLWRLVGVDLSPGGRGGTEYACELCPATLVVPAGGVPPATN